MQELTIEERKKLSLEILKEVIEFCDSNNIKYYIFYGTLLGAVRHKGFIPWDDDIDICVPRLDYEKFLEIFSSSKLKTSNYRIIGKYPTIFTKVFSSNTLGYYKNYQELGFGVSIDIFPIDVVPEKERKVRSLYNEYKILYKFFCHSFLLDKKLYTNKIKYIFDFVISHLFDYKKIGKFIEMKLKRNFINSSSFSSVFLASSKLRIFRKENFEIIEIPFENLIVKAPKDYDDILRKIYGSDYMTPPPVDKRTSTHEEKYYWVENN